jgi:hypothetical protein
MSNDSALIRPVVSRAAHVSPYIRRRSGRWKWIGSAGIRELLNEFVSWRDWSRYVDS